MKTPKQSKSLLLIASIIAAGALAAPAHAGTPFSIDAKDRIAFKVTVECTETQACMAARKLIKEQHPKAKVSMKMTAKKGGRVTYRTRLNCDDICMSDPEAFVQAHQDK